LTRRRKRPFEREALNEGDGMIKARPELVSHESRSGLVKEIKRDGSDFDGTIDLRYV
jgi:hypothetical protein